MKKILIISLSITSLITVPTFVALPIIKIKSSKNENVSSEQKPINILKFKSNLTASNFGFTNKKPSEAKEEITKSWLIKNKDDLFVKNNYLNSEEDIESFKVFEDEYNIRVNVNGVQGVIYDFFPEKSELFNSMITFSLKENETINTYQNDDKSILNAIVEFLYFQHKSLLINDPIEEFLQKAKINDGFLELFFNLKNINEKKIFEKTILGRKISEIEINDKFIKDTSILKIQFKVNKNDYSYSIRPRLYELTLSNGIRKIEIPTSIQNKFSSDLKFRTRSDKPIGELLVWPSVIINLPAQVNRRIEVKEFGINEVQSLTDIGKKISTIDFVWNNKEKLLNNFYDFEHKELIQKVEYEVDYATTSIKLTINWKGWNETTDINIFVDEAAQIQFMGLDNIKTWNSLEPKKITDKKLNMTDFRATIMRDVFYQQQEFFNTKIQFKDVIEASEEYDEFLIQLDNTDPNYNLAWDLTFKSWWEYDSYNSWKNAQINKQSILKINEIENIQLYFKIFISNKGIFPGTKMYVATCVPTSVVITYKNNVHPNIKLNYNFEQQQKSQTIREFVIVN